MERPKKKDYIYFGTNLYEKIHYCKEYSKALKKYIDYLESKEEWISVEYRLPEKYGKYWVYRAGCDKMHYRIWNGTGWASDSKEITHWKPLPKPPIKK